MPALSSAAILGATPYFSPSVRSASSC